MLDRIAIGEIPAKPHTALRAATGQLRYEECLTRAGFDGPFSMLYHLHRPHALSVEPASPLMAAGPVGPDAPLIDTDDALRRRHYRTQLVPNGRALLDARTPLLENVDLSLSIAKPTESESVYFMNADADELLFVRQGRGLVRSAFGDLPFGANDYVCIPKGILRRVLIEEPSDLLVIEAKSGLGIPAQFRNEVGQLRMDAPYSHRDFRRPSFRGPLDEGINRLVVKRLGRHHAFVSAHSPLDVIGWDGSVYPWAFPILAFQPRVSSIHLPPTWHGTFVAKGALICSFVPRPLDFHPDAIPCPYPHASVDVDEILYYVRGHFGSRSGVEVGSVTLHPRGVPHGPHPGRYEASVGTTRTDELAVMLDCYAPLTAHPGARTFEDRAYDESFAGG
ncbi:MAG TPA: homogentisate 1,2-dioxygenase [Polyangiales bacterium]|jgi:homogentisate 1,2-dioxygenase